MKASTQGYIWSVVTNSLITITYWLAADPPSPWIFALTGAGILVCFGIIKARTRAGHFDKN